MARTKIDDCLYVHNISYSKSDIYFEILILSTTYIAYSASAAVAWLLLHRLVLACWLIEWLFLAWCFLSLYIAMLSLYPLFDCLYWNGFVHFWSSLNIYSPFLPSLSLFQMFVHVMIFLSFGSMNTSLSTFITVHYNAISSPLWISSIDSYFSLLFFQRDAVSLGFLSSYFQVSLSLRIGILSSQEGVALDLRRAQLNLTKLTVSFHCAKNLWSCLPSRHSELTADFLFLAVCHSTEKNTSPWVQWALCSLCFLCETSWNSWWRFLSSIF